MKMDIGTYRPIHGSNGRFTSFKTGARKVWFWSKVVGTGSLFMVVAYGLGVADKGNTAYAQNIIFEVPKAEKGIPAVMQRIAGCESEGNRNAKGKQFNKDGSVVTHVNADGTTDVGKYQINMQKEHIQNLARLHLDVMTEEGNEAYAMWIYENQGTGAWYSSRSCWQ